MIYPDFAEWAEENPDKLTQQYLDYILEYELEYPQYVDDNFGVHPHPCLKWLMDRYEEIEVDYEAVRWVMVNGGIKKTSEDKNVLQNSTRDPCWGFLNIRKEIVVILMKHINQSLADIDKQKGRWGACDFFSKKNNVDGDMMHFDLGVSSFQKTAV